MTNLTRRSFSIGALAASVAACKRGADVPSSSTPPVAGGGDGSGRLLILGGTGFLGPHVVDAAQAAGYEVTLFNRGKTNPHLFPDLEKLRGDRNSDVSALKGRRFDVVVDTSGYFPRQVEATTSVLGDGVGRYVFVSSISAFADLSRRGLDESAKVAAMPEPYSEKMPDNYGALKAGCERAATDALQERALIVRPGLIVGPGDPTDRFTYWPVRVAKGGPVLAPNDPDDPVQFVDARDLSAFMIDAATDGRYGTYSATGPASRSSIGALLNDCRAVSGSDARFIWAPTSFLKEQEVAPWMQLTVWVPPDDEEFGGMGQINVEKAVAAGLAFRPARETIRDTLAWWDSLPEARRSKPRAGLSETREREVLATLAAVPAPDGALSLHS